MSQSNPILQLKKNPRSRSLAIKAKCAEGFGCTEDHLEKGYRQSIRECPSTNCALYDFRPFNSRKKALKTSNPSSKQCLKSKPNGQYKKAKKSSKVTKN